VKDALVWLEVQLNGWEKRWIQRGEDAWPTTACSPGPTLTWSKRSWGPCLTELTPTASSSSATTTKRPRSRILTRTLLQVSEYIDSLLTANPCLLQWLKSGQHDVRSHAEKPFDPTRSDQDQAHRTSYFQNAHRVRVIFNHHDEFFCLLTRYIIFKGTSAPAP